MKIGVATSFLVHSLAVGFGLVSMSTPKPMNVADVEALPIEIVPVESITRNVAGDLEATTERPPAPKPTERPQTIPDAQNIGESSVDKQADADEVTNNPPVEKTQAPVAAPEPTPEPPQPDPEPEAAPELQTQETEVAALPDTSEEPAPSEQPAEETFATPERVAVPKVRPNRTAASGRKKEDAGDKIAALLNKEDASAGGAKRSTGQAGAGTRKGNAAKLSQSELDALRGQIQGCWNVVGLSGLDDAEKLRARVEFRLKPDGSIDGRPSVSASGSDSRTNRTFAGSARRAVIGCAPYRLPADKYENWADVVVNFSLKDML